MTFASWAPRLLLLAVAGSLLVLICVCGKRSEACEEDSGAPAINFIINEKEAESREDQLYPGFDVCIERADGRTFPMMDCYSEGAEYWDAQLEIVLEQALASCKGAKDREKCVSNLKDMHKNWKAYIDAMGGYIYQGGVSGPVGGTLDRVNGIAFRAMEAKAHVDRLKGLLGE